jgi:hypothetical protein
MDTDKFSAEQKDTSKTGREEEVVNNDAVKKHEENTDNNADKSKEMKKDTEGEKRFREGLANNSDTES